MRGRAWDTALEPQSLPCLEQVRKSGSHSSAHDVTAESEPHADAGMTHQGTCLPGKDTQQLNKWVLSEGGAVMRDARQGHGAVGARGWGKGSSLCGLEGLSEEAAWS